MKSSRSRQIDIRSSVAFLLRAVRWTMPRRVPAPCKAAAKAGPTAVESKSQTEYPMKCPQTPRPYVRRVMVARPRGKQRSGVALDRPEPSPKLSEGEP